MMNTRSTLWYLFLLFSGFRSLSAQSERNFYGREFWVTFTENLYKDTFNHLLVTPQYADTIRVFNPQLGIAAVFPVRPGVQNIIKIPVNSAAFWYSPATTLPTNTGVRVTSRRGPFSLVAVNTVASSTDMAAVIPLHVLESSRDYTIHTAAGNTGKEGLFSVIAVDTGTTTIEVTQSCFTPIGGAGKVFQQKLKYGQVFSLPASNDENLSGTRVRVVNSCKRIVIFTGARCAKVLDVAGCNSCDVLYEQAWPAWALGQKYFVPSVPDNKNWIVSVYVLKNGTTISQNGTVLGVYNIGEVQIQASNPVLVEADNPVSCELLLKSNGCNGASGANSGDPSSVMVPPVGAGTHIAGLSVFRNVIYTSHRAVICAQTTNVPSVKLNSNALPSGGWQHFITAGKSFWYNSQMLSYNNTWVFESDTPFIIYQFGQGPFESYATCSGASFTDKKASVTATPNPLCNFNTPVQFSAAGDSLASFVWYFGDGTNGSGKNVSHRYGAPGTYKAGIINTGSGGCSDSVSVNVLILQGPPLPLLPDTQPCKGSVITLNLTPRQGYSYLWDDGSGVYKRVISSSRKVWVLTKDSLGCTSTDTMDINFKFCDKYDLRLANVFTPNGDGFNDEWKVLYQSYKKVDVTILNRWGEVIYRYSLPDDPHWNGKVENGFTECPEGVYFYRIAVFDQEDNVRNFNGSIELLR